MTEEVKRGVMLPGAGDLKYIEDFWKETDRAVVVGQRLYNDSVSTVIEAEYPVASMGSRAHWAIVKDLLRAELDRLAAEEGIIGATHASPGGI